MAAKHLPIVGVIGSSKLQHADLAQPIGRLLATLGVHLVTGAGPGVMWAVSKAFADVEGRLGSVVGIVPCRDRDTKSEPEGRTVPKRDYPNAAVEIPVFTHLLGGVERSDETRNHVVVLTAKAIVALPGDTGTAIEVDYALRYGRPIIAHFSKGRTIEGLPDAIEQTADLKRVEEFLRQKLPLQSTT
jgi:predicted Rossmann-fold nucleotide-binding protein